MIPQAKFFLGYPLSKDLAARIDSLPASQRDLYIQSSGEYLTDVRVEKKRYLGKYCGDRAKLEDLAMMEKNIYSLLEKIVPDYPLGKTSLILFPVID